MTDDDEKKLPIAKNIPITFNRHTDDHLYLVASHAYWKERLFDAIENQETLDLASVGRDDCCDLGKWLHNEDVHPHISHLQSYHRLMSKHAAFHAEVGKVAHHINAKKYEDARRLLSCESAFERASAAVISEIFCLKAEYSKKYRRK